MRTKNTGAENFIFSAPVFLCQNLKYKLRKKTIYCTIFYNRTGWFFMVKKWLSAAKTIILPLLVGLLSGLLIRNDTGLYDVLIRPPFSLPGNLFSVVWIILFLLMGVSLYLFKQTATDNVQKSEGKLLFFIQLFLNFLWPIFFFHFRLFFASFLLLLLLFAFIILTTANFYRANHISGILLLPYAIYTAYAGYLNFAIWLLNM